MEGVSIASVGASREWGGLIQGETGGYDRNNDTTRNRADTLSPEMLENMVELVGIEPTTSSLRTMRSPS